MNPTNSLSYYVARDGVQSGPIPDTEVLRKLAEGSLAPTDLCWREGLAGWITIQQAFQLNIPQAPVAPPPPAYQPPQPQQQYTPAEPQYQQQPQPYGAPAPAPHPGAYYPPAAQGPLFLYIPPARLVLMSILSFNLYEAYWVYKNWAIIKQRDGLDISPFWRGIFGVFFIHALLRRIEADPQARQVQLPTFNPGMLATVWIVLLIASNVISRADSVLITMLAALVPSFLCLLPVQNYINSVTKQRSPALAYQNWSTGHIVLLGLGLLIWAGMFLALLTEGTARITGTSL